MIPTFDSPCYTPFVKSLHSQVGILSVVLSIFESDYSGMDGQYRLYRQQSRSVSAVESSK